MRASGSIQCSRVTILLPEADMTEKNISPEKTGQKLIITDRKILDLT